MAPKPQLTASRNDRLKPSAAARLPPGLAAPHGQSFAGVMNEPSVAIASFQIGSRPPADRPSIGKEDDVDRHLPLGKLVGWRG